MGLIVEGDVESSLFQAALAAVPDVTLELVDIRTGADGEGRFVLWGHGGDLDAFERALGSDPTVAGHRVLAEVDDRRLYRISLSAAGEGVATYRVAWEEDIVAVELTVREGGMHVLARLPSREALLAYQDALVGHDVPFTIERLFSEVDDGAGRGDSYGVTEPQREALVAALEAGYFDVPRRAELQAVAEEVSVSPQAFSARLRRGQAALVRNTLASDRT